MAFKYDPEFFEYLEEWLNNLEDIKITAASANPKNTALFVVDVTKGFCSFGPLSSDRVGTIVKPIVELLNLCWEHDIRHYLLPQDTHDANAEEFSEYPSHCVRGTAEAETVDQIQNLPFYDMMTVFEKNSINSGVNPGVRTWLDTHPEVDSYFVVGDCTDLCIYQLATYLKTDANEKQVNRRIIIPENCVDTYDLPVKTAREIGGFPHHADLMHDLFLNHMALNGIEIYKKIIP